MKKLTAALLAALLLWLLPGCDGSGTPGSGTSQSTSATPAIQISDEDGQLAAFFGGDIQNALDELSPVLFAFAQAIHAYPEVMNNLPDDNFGWAYLYHLIAVYSQGTEGIQRRSSGITATGEAVAKLQTQTLGGALWSTPGKDFAALVQYDGTKDVYTLANSVESAACGAYIADVSYRTDMAAADVIVVLYNAAAGEPSPENTLARYVLTLRSAPSSDYGYHIASFGAA